jgi:hypothetical protein
VERNATAQQAAAVAVAVAQRDAEQPGRQEGAIHRHDRERHRQAIVGAYARNRDGMRHVVIGHRIEPRSQKNAFYY